MLKLILEILQNFFGGKPPELQRQEPERPKEIDWSNPKSMISKYFSVHNATYLPSWQTYHQPTDEEKKNILEVAGKMDLIREFLNSPIRIHVWIRPENTRTIDSKWSGKDYNDFVKGAPKSSHKIGKAVDWSVADNQTKEYCAEVRSKLLSKLVEWEIRMEDIDGNWVHIDTAPVVSKRFFKP